MSEKQYLDDINELLAEYEKSIRALTERDPDPYGDLFRLINEVVEKEEELRRKHEIGDRYKVIQDQLQNTLEKYQHEYDLVQQQKQQTATIKERVVADDETIVFVYLYNTQGDEVSSWQKLLLPKALFEHSVNRPIYANKDDIERVIRSRPNKSQQAFFEIIIKKDQILADNLHDQFNHTLFRLKQGALKIEDITALYFQGIKYIVEHGKIIGLTSPT